MRSASKNSATRTRNAFNSRWQTRYAAGRLPAVCVWSSRNVVTLTCDRPLHIKQAATWRTLRNNVALDSGPSAPLCENTTSSAKPKLHNVLHSLHCSHRRTEPWPQVTCRLTNKPLIVDSNFAPVAAVRFF